MSTTITACQSCRLPVHPSPVMHYAYTCPLHEELFLDQVEEVPVERLAIPEAEDLLSSLTMNAPVLPAYDKPGQGPVYVEGREQLTVAHLGGGLYEVVDARAGTTCRYGLSEVSQLYRDLAVSLGEYAGIGEDVLSEEREAVVQSAVEGCLDAEEAQVLMRRLARRFSLRLDEVAVA